MKINKIALLMLVFIISGCASGNVPAATPTEFLPTSTSTPIPTDTPSPTYTLSPTLTETGTPTLPPGLSPRPVKLTSKTAILVPDIGSDAQSLVWSQNEDYLFIGTFDKGMAIYDVVHKKLLSSWGKNANVSSLAISPDGKTLAAGLANDGSIRLLSTEELTIFPAHQGTVQVLAFSPDGKSVASGGDDRNIFVWDVKTGKMIKKFDDVGLVSGLVYSPDGKTLIAGLGGREKFYLWNTDTWELQNTFPADQVYDLAISTDGSKMVSAGGGIHEANLWDVKTGKLLFKLQKDTEGSAWAVSYDPSGKFVALGGGGGIVFLWDASSGNLVKELNIDSDFNFISALAFNPDGTQIATAGNRVMIWNLETP